MFQSIVFDLDGTLVDAFEDIRQALNHAIRPFGLRELTLAETTARVGNGLLRLLDSAISDHPLPPEAREQIARDFLEYYHAHIIDYTRPYPGIEDVLRAARDHDIKLAVLSNKPHELTTRIIEGTGLAPFFALVCGKQPNLPCKPDPESLRLVLRELNAVPAETLVVGDGETDMEVARAVGTRVAACLYGGRSREQLAPYSPDYWIAQPKDILAIFCGK
ncbi:MAG: HAD family hydrolase [Candidatus Sumerlaeota bacterium]|nr:HAD family hydrolase [Candidatus Sumerlaeota bacterium]